MSDFPNYDNEPQIQPRNPLARPGPIPDLRLDGLLLERAPSIIPRQDASSTTSSSSSTRSSCGPKETEGFCERPTSGRDNTTLPITLGVVIPLAFAFIIMIVLHRRNVKKQRREDAEDRHKSLDFGLGPGGHRRKKGKKGISPPEMTINPEGKRARGLSLDIGTANPFLLPPGLQHSRESLHSLSRAFNTGDDKYTRTDFIPDDGSIRSSSRVRRNGDDSSSYTGSSKPRFDYDSSQTLVQTSSRSGPPTRRESPTSTNELSSEPLPRKPVAPPKDSLLAPAPLESGRDSYVSTTSCTGQAAAFRKSNDDLSAFIRGNLGGVGGDSKNSAKETPATVREISSDSGEGDIQPPPPIAKHEEGSFGQQSQLDRKPSHSVGLPSNPRLQPQPQPEPQLPELNLPDLSDLKSPNPPAISVTEHVNRQNDPPSVASQDYQGHSRQDSQSYSREASYYGPQGDSQNQTREVSYYGQQYHSQDQYDQHTHQHYDNQGYDQYSQDYQQYDQHDNSHVQHEHYDDGEDYYDPEEEYADYSNFVEDLGYDPRRATWGTRPLPPDDPSENPEQRANRIRSFYKEYFDAPNGSYPQGYPDGSDFADDYYYQDEYHHQRGYSSAGSRHRGHTFSNGSYAPGPRAFSSASGRYGYPHGRPGPRKPKKKIVPPKALNVLPTPSKLKDDTFLLDQALDFAPPNKAMFQRAGTPDSLRGGKRAYSPTVKAFIPMASSFDDLAAMPSPHQLRRSGTFTALDFAAPGPRFRGQDTMSETGSIRSNRSGLSAMHAHNIRAGAYRLSRIPKEVAGTKDELSQSLRPKWDMSR